MQKILLKTALIILAACAVSFADSDKTDSDNAKQKAFETSRELAVAYPKNAANDEKELADNALKIATSKATFELLTTVLAVKWESASKKFFDGYADASAADILKKSIKISADPARKTVSVKVSHADKNIAEFLCFDAARCLAHCARDAGIVAYNDYLLLNLDALKLVQKNKENYAALKHAQSVRDTARVRELQKALQPQKFTKERTLYIKSVFAKFASFPPLLRFDDSKKPLK